MRHSKILFVSVLATLTLASCNMDFSIHTSSSADSGRDSSSASSQETSSSTSVPQGELTKTTLRHNMKSVQKNGIYDLSYSPTIGESKLLVIPVWFTDSTTFIASSSRENVREDIRTAYFGSTSETGWHSVKSFYEEESQRRLTLSGTVSEWYECGKSYKTFGPEESGGNATMDLVPEAADWYFKNHTGESRKDYDKDGDGYLDGVLLIYAAPDYDALKKSSWNNLWAYCYWEQESKYQSLTNPGVNVFFWASYDFMYSSSKASSRTGKSNYHHGDTSHCIVDAHTFIHEMGHVLGLDDYYDYGSNTYEHAGGFSMQDYNIGGHDPYSTMAFGWSEPYIPTSSCQVTIGSFQKTHDLILLTPSWNSVDSPFDEYLLLELYTPTGLNKLDCDYSYSGNTRGPNATGIRLWHVDARLAYATTLDKQGYPVLSTSKLTADPDKGATCYGVTGAFTNTVGVDGYSGLNDDYNLLKLIRNNKSAPLHNKNYIKTSDLFANGSSFSMTDYKSQFKNKTKLNSNKELGWSFSVSISGTGHDATATVTLIKA